MYREKIEKELLKTKTTKDFLDIIIREGYDESWSKELETHYNSLPREKHQTPPPDYFLTKEKRDELNREKKKEISAGKYMNEEKEL